MILSRLLTIAFAGTVAAASAQAPAPPGSSGTAMKLPYESAFADYRPFAEIEIISWKQANSDAAALGGHMGQMKHKAAPTMTPKSEAATTPLPSAPASGAMGQAAHPR